ncbi:CRISPR-associated protein Cas2 [Dethiosulfovibrio peptidovorans DSM 11002]|uniref:CRISPR-associated endoribonuclease Cas2 n=1 Tax=Dethiosulfovibrio peptidovorans DSM 11002 TaxID=469381 RepID=D2Z4I5_9BACT|nr:CRISPR-associated endonuclease Cas2 [Dethiosulfovibrio peptidovorans]EFC90514.1 CRISPR-associated protein Cas2 [Dethiosulfovibrio peptidovorans DSM 11002]
MFVIMIYDVGERRVAKMLKIGRKYLNWVQNSVLEGELSEGLLAKLKAEVKQKIDHESDSVIFYTWRSERYTAREVIGIERNEINIIV